MGQGKNSGRDRAGLRRMRLPGKEMPHVPGGKGAGEGSADCDGKGRSLCLGMGPASSAGEGSAEHDDKRQLCLGMIILVLSCLILSYLSYLSSTSNHISWGKKKRKKCTFKARNLAG